MKTLLIYPPCTSSIADPIKANPPLGLAYIAAYLEKHNYDVKILDALALGIDNAEKKGEFIKAGLNDDQIRSHIRKYDPNVVGVYGGNTMNMANSYNCARIAKEVNENATVVFGGPHSTAFPQMTLRNKNVDIITKGEGEITFLEIVKRIEKQQRITDVEGTILRQEDKIIVNKDRPFIENLDLLPLPARHLLPMHIYAKQSKYTKDHYMRHPRTNMISSRGCPGNCVFCSIHSIWGHKWRARSANNVLDEIAHLYDEYGIREIAFYDDNISADKKRLIEICKGIEERKLDLKFDTPNGVAIWSLDEEVIKHMAKAGFYRLTFGIESACPSTQKYIRKIMKPDFCNKIIKTANDAGLWTTSTFIIGFPNETMESIKMTEEFILKSDLDFCRVYIAAPLPGTDMYKDYVKEGLIEDYSEKSDVGEYVSVSYGGVNTNYFSAKELRQIQSKMYSKFIKSRIIKFLNPLRLLKKVNSLEEFRYLVKVGSIALEAKFARGEQIVGKLNTGISEEAESE